MKIPFGLDSDQVIVFEQGFPKPNEIQNAVVFISAGWSAQSKQSLSQLTAALRTCLDSSWKLVILNTDEIDIEKFVEAYGTFPSSGGYGEAFWIKDGTLRYGDRGYYCEGLIALLWKRMREFSSKSDIPVHSDNSNFAEVVRQHCPGFPESRMEIHLFDCFDFANISKAVIAMYQPNRAQAITNMRALAQIATIPDLRLIVLNSEAVSYSEMQKYFQEPPQAGRTYWIRDGKIIYKHDALDLRVRKSDQNLLH